MIKKYCQYYKYIPPRFYSGQAILQIFKYWKFEIGSTCLRAGKVGNYRRRRAGPALSDPELVEGESKGFTLVEIIMYMGILTFLLLILTQLLSQVLSVQLESEATSSVQQDGRLILARLTYDINRAEDIVLPATPGASTDTLELTIDGVSNKYSLSTEDLVISNDLGLNNLNSYGTTISNLSFKRLGNVGGKPTITASFTLQSVTSREKGPEIKNFQITAGTR